MALVRLGWRLRLLRIGPFTESLSGTHWRSKRRQRPFWHGTLPDGWVCQHEHRREDTAVACANRELRRRRALAGAQVWIGPEPNGDRGM